MSLSIKNTSVGRQLFATFQDDASMVTVLFSYEGNIKKMILEHRSIKAFFQEALKNFHNIAGFDKLIPTITDFVKNVDIILDEHSKLVSTIQSKAAWFHNSESPFTALVTLKDLLLELQSSIATNQAAENFKSLIMTIVSC